MTWKQPPAGGEPAAAGDLPLASPSADARTIAYRDDLAAVRQFTTAQARRAGLPPSRVLDLVIAVNELAANTLEHTSGPGTLTIWSTPGEVICQVSDGGHISDTAAGSGLQAPDGHVGLWVVRKICDQVHIQRSPHGTTIRLHMLLD
ncbi:MAG TPA: ATP-binding protein [Streptosporangiaceae bacterium]|nr:ATP-binding protein [Streptosporangiaceae bacterium]